MHVEKELLSLTARKKTVRIAGINALYQKEGLTISNSHFLTPSFVVDEKEHKKSPMITVLDKDLKKIGVLDDVAVNVSVEREVNQLWRATITLPGDSAKNSLCSHFNFIDIESPSGRYFGKYRIVPAQISKNESDDTITYELEHVLSTLLDDVIDGHLPAMVNHTTKTNIERILDFQTVKHWEVGNIEFERYFQYHFENENGLLAPLLSIVQPFDEPYEWAFDTKTYPWKLHLLKADNNIKAEIRWGKDMISFNEVSDPAEIVNYIIPKGAGEGVNQTNITSVNNGLNYLKDEQSIQEWGVKKYIWQDKKYKHPETLKANAQALLNQWKDPKISFSVSSVDLSVKPEYKHEQKLLNGVTQIIVGDKKYKGRIIRESISDLIGEEFKPTYEINNKLDDIATSQTAMEKKLQVNESYSQGATNISQIPFYENCDPNYPAMIEFPFPDDMVYVNEARLRIKTTHFRGYTRGMKSAGNFIQEQQVKTETTEGGGGQTTSAGGGVSKSTRAGGGRSVTSSSKEFDRYLLDTGVARMTDDGHVHPIIISGGHFEHSHSVYFPDHAHEFTLNDHSHTVDDHTHEVKVTIPSIEIPGHTHDQEYGIWLNDSLPDTLTVKVDGQTVSFNGIEGEIDITEHLEKDNDGKVSRGWHTVEVTPDDLARIEMLLTTRFFIQSDTGKQL